MNVQWEFPVVGPEHKDQENTIGCPIVNKHGTASHSAIMEMKDLKKKNSKEKTTSPCDFQLLIKIIKVEH